MERHDSRGEELGTAPVKGVVAAAAATATRDRRMWNSLSRETRQRSRSARPSGYPWQSHARGPIAHPVPGAVLEGSMRLLDRPPKRRRHRVNHNTT